MDLRGEKTLTCIALRYTQEQEVIWVEKVAMALKLEVVALRQEIQASCICEEVSVLDLQVDCLERGEAHLKQVEAAHQVEEAERTMQTPRHRRTPGRYPRMEA